MENYWSSLMYIMIKTFIFVSKMSHKYIESHSFVTGVNAAMTSVGNNFYDAENVGKCWNGRNWCSNLRLRSFVMGNTFVGYLILENMVTAHPRIIDPVSALFWHWSMLPIFFNATPPHEFTHLPWTKWPPFHRQYVQVHSHEWKVLYFD